MITFSSTKTARSYPHAAPLVAVLAIACATIGCTFLMPSQAYAEGDIHVTDVYFATDTNAFVAAEENLATNICPRPAKNDNLNIGVLFDKNVAYAQTGTDDTFIKENESRMHLQYADGTPVEGTWAEGTYNFDARRGIYIGIPDWLSPLTTYRIVVEPGITAANGIDVLQEEYVFEFTTSALCRNGLMLYDNILIAVAVIVAICGIVVQIVRTARARKR